MDGNGRWAKSRGLQRVKGHQKGAEVVREITTYCAKASIEYLTLYAFSTENWKRPQSEVDFLMVLLNKYLKNEQKTYQENGIRLKVIGDISKFSKKLQKTINKTVELTKNNTNLTQILALNYGSKDEIVRAVNLMIDKNIEITEQSLSNNLDTAGICDVDIMIRTSGEMRLSNYLLWQSAYAELYFTNTLWPDFNSSELESILKDFSTRQRRFGGL
jgi:undecaprenyl diphosphate synthase